MAVTLLSFVALFVIAPDCGAKSAADRPSGPEKNSSKAVYRPARDLPVSHELPDGVALVGERNGSIVPVSWRFRTEDYNYPGLVDLREREGLEDIIAEGETEFEKMRLLNDWVNSQWERGSPVPYPPWNANVILALVRSGKTGGFCAQYAVVMVQSCLSLGWQARYIDVAPQSQKAYNTHFTVEVWSNQYNKWVLLDPFFGCHFERRGVPLSGLELHRAFVLSDFDEIKLVKGAGENADKNREDLSLKDILSRYYHLAIDLRNDHMSRPHDFFNRRQNYLSWRDDHTDGRKDVFQFFTNGPPHFNFAMNQVRMRTIGGENDVINVMIRTNTAGLEALEINEGKGWKKYYSPFEAKNRKPALSYTLSSLYGGVFIHEWKISPGKNTLRVRSVNVSNVRGPEFSLTVSKAPVR